MRYRWVNQNQTYVHVVGGGYLWSTKVNANSIGNRFYDAMTEAALGDVGFTFCDPQIKAIGVVNGLCESTPKPTEFGTTGEFWANEGWYPLSDSPRLIGLSVPKSKWVHEDTQNL